MQLPARGNRGPGLIVPPHEPRTGTGAVAHGGAWRAGDAVLLIGHGSSTHATAPRVLMAHAGTLATEIDAGHIGVGFLSGTPTPAQALSALAAGTVHVVPFFMEDGYFTRHALPRALQVATQQRPCPAWDLRLHQPVGTHPRITDLILQRAARACGKARLDPSAVTVMLVGHGSARAPGRPLALHDHARRARATGGFAAVHAACLEEPPFAADILTTLPPGPVAILGLFAGEGLHATRDLPALVGAARSKRSHPVLDLGIIGADSGMPGIVRAILMDGQKAGLC